MSTRKAGGEGVTRATTSNPGVRTLRRERSMVEVGGGHKKGARVWFTPRVSRQVGRGVCAERGGAAAGEGGGG